MNIQLCYADAYARSVVGGGVSVEDGTSGGGPRLVLDRTVFSPGGGGQPPDRGTLLRAADGRVWTVVSARKESGDIVHELEGADLDVAAVRRAIQLSATRYCTASAMFSAGPAAIHHRSVVARGDGRPDESGEVVAPGPGEEPDRLGERWLAAAATVPAGAA